MAMTTENNEKNLEAQNEETSVEESDICTGDGTTCVECGKVFSHPFYFSTHIGTHTGHKGFIVVGQCTFCGLVFSDENIFNAHMTSSQSRQKKQVISQDDVSTESVAPDVGSELSEESRLHYDVSTESVAPDVGSELSEESRPHYDVSTESVAPDVGCELSEESRPHSKDSECETHKDHICDVADQNKDTTVTTHESNAITNVNSNTTNEEKPKRKRKAPDRFDPNPRKQSTSSKKESDFSVEADLSNVALKGSTVDPETISNHRKRKKLKKVSGNSYHEEDKSKKESTWIECVRDSSSEDEPSKETVQDYVYVDIDDSPVDDLEVVPEKLEQQNDKFDQNKEHNGAAKINTSHWISHNEQIAGQKKNISLAGDGFVKTSVTTEVPLTRSAVYPSVVKNNLPTLGPRPISYHNPKPSRTVLSTSFDNNNKIQHASNVGTINTARSQQASQIQCKTFTPSYLSQGVKMNSQRPAAAAHYVSRNNQHISSFTSPVHDRSSLYSAQTNSNHGLRTFNHEQRQVLEKNRNVTGNIGNTNVQISDSLEELKKDSRENVVEMLQSIGMIALTSTSLGQGKLFSSQKSKASLPSKRRADMIAGFNTGYSGGGFQNKINTSKILTPQQTHCRNNELIFGPEPFVNRNQVSSFGIRNNNHSSAQFIKNSSGVTAFNQQGTSYGREHVTNVVRGQHMHANVRGVISNTTIRGRAKPIASPNNFSGHIRTQRVANSVSKLAQSPHASSEIIIIDDDDDDVVEVISTEETNSSSLNLKNKLRNNTQLESKESTYVKTSKEENSTVDDNLICSISDIRSCSDNMHESPNGVVILEDPNCEDQNVDNFESNEEFENNLSQSGLHKNEKSNEDSLTAVNDLCDNKTDSEDGSDSDNGLNENADIMPGEDIHGWKVCLAEDSDSDDDCSTSSPGAHKLVTHDDDHLLPQNSLDHCSSSFIVTNHENSKDDDCSTLSPGVRKLPSHDDDHISPQNSSDHCSSSFIVTNHESSKDDDFSTLSPGAHKLSTHDDDHMSPQNNLDLCSSSFIITNHEGSKDDNDLSHPSCQNLVSQKLDLPSSPQIGANPEQHICTPQQKSLTSPKEDDSLLLRETVNEVFNEFSNQENMKIRSDTDDNKRSEISSKITCCDSEEKNCQRETNVDNNNLVSDSSDNLMDIDLPYGSPDSRVESLDFCNVAPASQDTIKALKNSLPDIENKTLSLTDLMTEPDFVSCKIISDSLYPALKLVADTSTLAVKCNLDSAAAKEEEQYCHENQHYLDPQTGLLVESVTYEKGLNFTQAGRFFEESHISNENIFINDSHEIVDKCELSSQVTCNEKCLESIESTFSTSKCSSRCASDRIVTSPVCEDESYFKKKGAETQLSLDNSEPHSILVDINPPFPRQLSSSSISCSESQTVYHSIDSMSDSFSSHSQTSQISAISSDFLKGENNLLDIFTEIEKTCREMEETQNNKEG